MLLIGLPVGFCFGLALGNLPGALCLLGFALAIGLLLDPLYNYGQHRRWDGDWPALFMVISGFLEGGILWLFLQAITIGQVKSLRFLAMPNTTFLRMYSTIWLIMFVANLGVLNVFSPYRRFKGGRFWD